MKRTLFALAALVAVHSHAEIVSELIEYTHNDVVLEGYLAYDSGIEDKRPGVLVVHEWWGMNEYAQMRTRQLAELGYVAFALDMYGKGTATSDGGIASAMSGKIKGNKDLMRSRAQAGLEVLTSQQFTDPDKLAAIGYCFGGTVVLELAYSGADIDGVASFHGGITSPQEQDTIESAILVLHGADDPHVPAESIDEFKSAMEEHDADWDFIAYEGAVHAFTNPDAGKSGFDGVAYDEEADRASWEAMQNFFNRIFNN